MQLLEKLAKSLQGEALASWFNERVEILKERDAASWEDYLADRKAKSILVGMLRELNLLAEETKDKNTNEYE